jgi:hypothetical protein
MGLEVHQLYQLRRSLVRKGAFDPLPRRAARKANKASAFVPVRVVSATPPQMSATVFCRLVHPSGWILECDGHSRRCGSRRCWQEIPMLRPSSPELKVYLEEAQKICTKCPVPDPLKRIGQETRDQLGSLDLKLFGGRQSKTPIWNKGAIRPVPLASSPCAGIR